MTYYQPMPTMLMNTGNTDANAIPEVMEDRENPDFETHFLSLVPLSNKRSSNIKLHTPKDVLDQCTKILEQLNIETKHFYHLPFELGTLRNEQRKDPFFSGILNYVEDNHLPSNIKKENGQV